MKIVNTAPLSTGLAITAVATTIAAHLAPGLIVESSAITFLWPFVHGGASHLTGNLVMFLLLSPILEERYGASRLLAVYALTAVVVALSFSSLFSGSLIGASGHVFAAIGMAAFSGSRGRDGENVIPLHLLLLIALFIGAEVIDSLRDDQVSQFAHIAGLFIGLAAGYTLNRRTPEFS